MSNKYLHFSKGGMEYGDTPGSLANVPIPTGDIRRFAIERVWCDSTGDDWPFCEYGQTSTQCTT